MARDFYQVLGVSKDADEKKIKQAFRKLAKQYHPDANPNDPKAEQRFKEINEAYEALGNPEKRKFYDRFGADYARYQEAGVNPDDFGRGGHGGFNFNDFANNATYQGGGSPFGNGSPFDDIFGSIFSGIGRDARTGGAQVKTAGRDRTQDVTISLREAYEGAIRYINRNGKRVKVNIPAGAKEGTKVRLEKQGDEGVMGGQAGDLYLNIHVEPDPIFQREDDDLYVNVTVDLFTALLGGEISVPTMGRAVMVKVGAGTQSGQKLRLAGKGMPKLKAKGQFGDLFVVIQIAVPKNLTPEQIKLAEQLRDSLNR
jgi:curved DNA-binding protein